MNFVASAWDIIWEAIGWFQIATFLDEWEEGVLLRRGKFVRVVGAGIVWHLPFEIDEIHTMNIRPTALELDAQVVSTGDGKTIACRGVLMWGIFDIKKALLDVEDAEDTLADIAVGIIQEMIEQQEWDYIQSPDFRRDITKAVQKQARKWGIGVTTFKFQDLTTTRAYRFFTE